MRIIYTNIFNVAQCLFLFDIILCGVLLLAIGYGLIEEAVTYWLEEVSLSGNALPTIQTS